MEDKREELYIEIMHKAGIKDDILVPVSPDQLESIPILSTESELQDNDR